jgi:Variant SH3 domain
MMSAVRTMLAMVAHQIPDRPALQLAVGERVDVGDRDSEWPEFVFVTASHGTGWVPARHLSATSGMAIVQTVYDTTELPTHAGDVVEVVAEDLTSGWLWCRARDGREGWVPIKTLQAAEPSISDQRP